MTSNMTSIYMFIADPDLVLVDNPTRNLREIEEQISRATLGNTQEILIIRKFLSPRRRAKLELSAYMRCFFDYYPRSFQRNKAARFLHVINDIYGNV